MRFHKLEEYLRSAFGRSMLGIGRGSADFAQLVRDAQKFYVGDVCVLAGVRQGEASEYPRLPFPMCLFEFQDQDPKGISRPFFLLAEELGDSEPSLDCVRIHSFIPYPTHSNEGDLWLHNGWIEFNRKTGLYDSFVNKMTLEFLGPGEGFERIADQDSINGSILNSASWLLSFLTVLNCSNVDVSEVAAPTKLNLKRARNNKPPIYSYKTLVLKKHKERLAIGSGSHESPRIHLRRGHIKRRATGNFWWEPHVVGDRAKGIVAKDYSATDLITP